MFQSELVIVPMIVIGLPWLILHYVTRWKTASTLTRDDEALLDDLYHLARRLEDRLETVERLVVADNPEFRPAGKLGHNDDDAEALHQRQIDQLRELAQPARLKGRTAK